MKLLYLVIPILLLCSCRKGSYTCVCEETTTVNGPQQLTIPAETQADAISRCTDFETDLNKSSGNYTCRLD